MITNSEIAKNLVTNNFLVVAKEYKSTLMKRPSFNLPKADTETLLAKLDEIKSLPPDEVIGEAFSKSDISLTSFKNNFRKCFLSAKELYPSELEALKKYSTVGKNVNKEIYEPLENLLNMKRKGDGQFSVDMLNESINFKKLLPLCNDIDGNPSIKKINLVTDIIKHKNSKTFLCANQTLQSCIVGKDLNTFKTGIFSEVLLKASKELLDCGTGDVSPFIYNSIKVGGKLNGKALAFAKELLTHPKITDSSDALNIFNICIDSKHDVIPRFAKDINKFLASNKVKNASDCVDLFDCCHLNGEFDADLLNIASNALKRNEIENPKQLCRSINIVKNRLSKDSIDKTAFLKTVNSYISYGVDINSSSDLAHGLEALKIPYKA